MQLLTFPAHARQWRKAFVSALPNHSDEIVQDFHLFPFYLLSALFRAAAAPDASSIVMGDILASL